MNERVRPTIGYLTTFFASDMINYSIWNGILAQAREEDVNVIAVPGNPPRSQVGYERQANMLYDLVNKEMIQGLVIWGGGLWAQTEQTHIMEFFHRFADYPTVSLSAHIEGVPSVGIDNYSSMFQLCSHLIEVHGCRRLAFFRGPPTQEEAQERFRAYRACLAAHGLSYVPELVYQGDFIETSNFGHEGVRLLLEERRASFDVIVSANDTMAIGAFEELEARGISVPEVVKLVGFDDIIESRLQPSPLTTVHQPFFDLGKAGLRNVRAIMRNEPVNKILLLPCRLVIRQSCGCPPASPVRTGNNRFPRKRHRTPPSIRRPALPRRALSAEALARRLRHVLSEPFPSPPLTHLGPDGDTAPLIGDFIGDVSGTTSNVFLPSLSRLLARCREFDDTDSIRSFLLGIYNRCGRLTRPAAAHQRAGELIRQGLSMSLERSNRIISRENVEKTKRTYQLQMLSRDLGISFHLSDIMAVIARALPSFGITMCFLSLFEHPQNSLSQARLRLALTERGCLALPADGLSFPSRELVPSEIRSGQSRVALVLEALYYQEDRLGFVVFGESTEKNVMYGFLRNQLSTAIKGALLFEEKERLLEKVKSHSTHLESLMRSLRRSNEDLEQFSYAASHDLKEPLRKISIFTERLTNGYRNLLDERGNDYLTRLGSAVTRMAQLITDILHYSHLTTKSRPFQSVDLSQILAEVLSDIETLVESKNARVTADALPRLEAESVQMRQLFQNLIINAIKFHKPGLQPEVAITHSIKRIADRDWCEIIFADNGIGIGSEYFEKIFVIFQRLHGQGSYEGTGIGLALCKKIVEQHQGAIRVESELGRGTRFIVTLPLYQFF